MFYRVTLNLRRTSGRSLRIGSLLARAWAQLQAWREIYRQRRALLGLSEAMLKDIGISRADAFREGTKPFWRS